MADQQALKNIAALKKKQFEVKFDLSGTNYEPLKNIGIGAYGVVCSAVHKVTKEKVAIKKTPDIFQQPVIALRTYREIKVLKHFKHSNIIYIREILKPPDDLNNFKDVYIVLDLMESDLHRIIHSKQELTEEHFRYFLYQLLRGLKYIHSANVIHRDLKPSNLLINENCDLKIGDFGMARGVSSDPESYNHLMTQYVATRWYRAPELMMAKISYTSSVDIWSVGCILAEMLGRTQLFPGNNMMDQMKKIIHKMGTPSPSFFSLMGSDLIRKFVKGLGDCKPIPMKQLLPKASKKALDLLDKMLRIDPRERISTEAALKHLFLNKYHVPSDEPICVPAFDFSFENKQLSPKELKDALVKESMDYHKPKKTNFKFVPVPASEIKPPSPMGSQSKFKFVPVPSSENKTNKAASGKLNQMAKKQEVATNQLSSFKKPLDVTSQSKQTNLTVGANQQATIDVEMLSAKSDRGDSEIKSAIEPVKTEAKLETDIDMHSAPLKESAGMSLEVKPPETEVKPAKPLDAKEALKAALLNSMQKKQSEGYKPKPKPVTALQKHKEREEQRKQKKEKAQLKRKMKNSKVKDVHVPTPQTVKLLTEQDKNLLERWKTMQKIQPKRDTPTAQPTGLPTTTIITHPTDTNLPLQNLTISNANNANIQIAGNFQPVGGSVQSTPAMVFTNRVPVDQNAGISNVLTTTVTTNTLVNSSGTLDSKSDMGSGGSFLSALESLSTPPDNTTVQYPQEIPIQTDPRVTNPPAHPFQIPLNTGPEMTPHTSGAHTIFTPQNNKHPPSYNEAIQAKPQSGNNPDINSQSQNVPYFSATNTNNSQFSTIAPGALNTTIVPGVQNTTISTDALSPASQNSPAQVNPLPGSINTTSPSLITDKMLPAFSSEGPSPFLSYTTSSSSEGTRPSDVPPLSASHLKLPCSADIDTFIESLTQQFSKSHMETLQVRTPVGTGEGYGVGLDLEMMSAEPREQGERLHSASAVKDDWADVTNMSEKDFMDALQSEMVNDEHTINFADIM